MKFPRRRGVLAWKQTDDDMFSIETTLDQSIQALNLASERAARNGDSEGLTNAAHGWMRLTETIHTISQMARQEQEQREEMSGGQQTGFGFRAPEHPEPARIDENEPVAGRNRK